MASRQGENLTFNFLHPYIEALAEDLFDGTFLPAGAFLLVGAFLAAALALAGVAAPVTAYGTLGRCAE